MSLVFVGPDEGGVQADAGTPKTPGAPASLAPCELDDLQRVGIETHLQRRLRLVLAHSIRILGLARAQYPYAASVLAPDCRNSTADGRPALIDGYRGSSGPEVESE